MDLLYMYFNQSGSMYNFLHLDLIDEKSNLLFVFPIFHVAGLRADSITVDDFQG